MRSILLFVLIAAAVPAAHAQSRHQTPANLGLGGGGTAYMDSYDANFLNPANLMLRNNRKTRLSIGFAGLSVGVGGPLADITTYNKYLTKDLTLTSQLSSSMLNEWFGTDPDRSSNLGYEIGVTGFGLSVHDPDWSASFATRSRVIGNIGTNRGLMEAFFHGLDPAVFGTGRPVNVATDAMAFSEVSIGLAMSVFHGDGMTLHVGAAPKFLLTHSVNRVDFTSTLTTTGTQLRHVFDYRIQTYGKMAEDLDRFASDYAAAPTDKKPDISEYLEPAADDFSGIQSTGFGLDLGATLVMEGDFIPIPNWGPFRGPRTFSVGVSVTDIGRLAVPDGTRFRSSGTVTFNGFSYDAAMIEDRFDGDFGAYTESVIRDSIGTDKYLGFVNEGSEKINRGLPTTVNLGTHLRMGRFGLMMDVGKGFNDRGINSTKLYTALGVEYRLFGFWPLRAGMRTGGYSNTTYHFGTGLEFRNVEFSLGAASSTSSKENGAGLSTAFSGLVLHF
jgi:hypothetical protein